MEKKTLHLGDHGEFVKELNSILKSLEYLTSDSLNEFDMRTRSAVEAFQNDNNIEVNGAVDAKTWQALEKVSPTIPAISGSLDVAASNDNGIYSKPSNAPSNYGEDILALQYQLKTLGYYKGALDGKIGDNTILSIKSFQDDNDLSPTGLIDASLKNTLRDSIIHAESKNIQTTVSLPTLRQGARGSEVAYLQDSLKNLGFSSAYQMEYSAQTQLRQLRTFNAQKESLQTALLVVEHGALSNNLCRQLRHKDQLSGKGIVVPTLFICSKHLKT